MCGFLSIHIFPWYLSLLIPRKNIFKQDPAAKMFHLIQCPLVFKLLICCNRCELIFGFRYMWGVGTKPGTDNIVKFKVEDRIIHDDCTNVSLTHNTTYYSTIIAFNGALNMMRVNSTSNGGIRINMTKMC